MEKVTSFIAYAVAVLLAWVGKYSAQDIALIVGAVVGVGTFVTNWYYRRKSYLLLKMSAFDGRFSMKSIVKRCSVAVVLALAALLPDFTRLHTSMAGLELIANLEGCRLSPYQCSAGVWTSGIGHTAGVKPGGVITEREAAVNLVADVMQVETPRAVYAGDHAATGL